MIGVIIAAADQGLARQIQSQLAEMGDADVVAIATTTQEAADAVLDHEADVTLVHEGLGPEPVLSLMRDISIRRPAVALLLVATEPDTELVTAAMESGARGLVTMPLTFGQVDSRVRAASAWSQQVRRSMTGAGGHGDDEFARGRTVGIAGAKGGVGATTVSCHLALDIARSVPWARVCLVDLDLEKGDVPGVIDVRHRVGVSDLAKVASDLSPGTVADAMTRHESGVDLLLAPVDVRDVEWVTPPSLRQVITALRREYDLVIMDLGSHSTPAQATAIELADEVVLVVTPDVAAVRGMRRAFLAWESLGVCKERDVRVLINRVSKQVTMAPDTIRQLTRATVLPHHLPAGYRRLEPAINARNPLSLHHPAWWAALRKVGRELGLVANDAAGRPLPGRPTPAPAPEPTPAPTPAPVHVPPVDVDAGPAGEPETQDVLRDATGDRPPEKAATGTTRRALRRQGSDDGLVAVEALIVFPIFLFLSLIVWHMAALGIAATLQANAASAASRAVSIGEDPRSAAAEALPTGFADGLSVSGGPGALTVTLEIRGMVPSLGLPDTISTTRAVVMEP